MGQETRPTDGHRLLRRPPAAAWPGLCRNRLPQGQCRAAQGAGRPDAAGSPDAADRLVEPHRSGRGYGRGEPGLPALPYPDHGRDQPSLLHRLPWPNARALPRRRPQSVADADGRSRPRLGTAEEHRPGHQQFPPAAVRHDVRQTPRSARLLPRNGGQVRPAHKLSDISSVQRPDFPLALSEANQVVRLIPSLHSLAIKPDNSRAT
ncbi:hypothetical protein MESS2_220007 [Mesorhizobium metallidurans STM 2683]|uniref:Uncharacterized protein n=1 Tax=Mesorhizobium metallidurans STM 2683 TaxID=1297569 RepID=M5EPF4_9HYPH|nr:hypothetical protein MESS2_220007 [Mesorhizobium metallidurans STM 2683]